MDPSLSGIMPIRVTLDIDGHESTVSFEIQRVGEKHSLELTERTPEQLFLLSESIRTAFIDESELVHDLVKRCAEAARSVR